MNECILHKLWSDIVLYHWDFIKTEEGLEKENQRKFIEDLLNEFLSNVPHERKFFLPQTAEVLEESMKNKSDFSAYKAMTAFEAISNYADNLATKPWRKEYRTIKMYSGYYEHEIKANLLNAEKMFIAMGYKILPNHTMVFEGIICTDQVVNVSRDAMVAVAECQIISEIFRNLRDLKKQFSWADIFFIRQKKSCGVKDAIETLLRIKDATFKSADYANWKCEKIGEEVYANSNGMLTKQCKQLSTSQHLPMAIHRSVDQNLCHSYAYCQMCHQMPQSNVTYNYGGGQLYNLNGPNMCQQMHPQPQPQPQPQPNAACLQMIHSKSLEHYSKHGDGNAMISPQRHSFDINHDIMDSRKGRSYHNNCNTGNVMWDHEFNVSGNRYPLPHIISQQLSNQYPCNDLPSTSASGDCNKSIYRSDQQLNEFPNDYRDSTNNEYCNAYVNQYAKAKENERYSKSKGYTYPSFDGTNNYVNGGSKINHVNIRPSNQEKSKNHDGVGSYESWSNVYEHLEKPKPKPSIRDFSDGDHLADCLALNSIDINVPSNNTIDKRRQSRTSDHKVLNEKYKTHTIEDNFPQHTSILKVQPIYTNQTTNSSHIATKSSLKSNGTIPSNNNVDSYQQLDRKLTKTLNLNERRCTCSYSSPIESLRCEKCAKSFIESNKPTSV